MSEDGARVRIEELRLAGFRAFENARLVLDDLTVLVGRNGAGKSTLVDAFAFLREALTDSLENALERRGGIQALVHRDTKAMPKELSIAVKLSLPRSFIEEVSQEAGIGFIDPHAPSVAAYYGFSLRSRNGGKGFFVVKEVAKSGIQHILGGSDVGALSDHPMYQHLMLAVAGQRMLFMRALLEALRSGPRAYKLSPAAIRTEPPIGNASLLSRDGSNLGDVLKRIEKNKDDLAWIVKHLGAITPGIVGIRPGTAAGRRIVQFLQSTGGTKPHRFEIGDMSDGTLHSLAILLALRQRPAPALVCIDEIEDSVHPAALAVLLDAVSASTERCQVLLTSHSPEALSHPAVTAARVRVVDWRDGRSEIFRLSPGAEKSSRPPRSVGTLLRTNALFTAESPERVEGDFFEGG